MDPEEQQAFFPATVMPDPGWWQALWPDPEGVITALGVKPGMTVLDLCCGDGCFTAALARQVKDGQVLGFDLDEQMLEAAASVCAGLENCTFLQGDAVALHRLLPEPVDYASWPILFTVCPSRRPWPGRSPVSWNPAPFSPLSTGTPARGKKRRFWGRPADRARSCA